MIRVDRPGSGHIGVGEDAACLIENVQLDVYRRGRAAIGNHVVGVDEVSGNGVGEAFLEGCERLSHRLNGRETLVGGRELTLIDREVKTDYRFGSGS